MSTLNGSGLGVLAYYIIFVLISTLFVVLRFVSIRILHRPTRKHDWLCVLSLVFLGAYEVDTLVGTIYGGFGQHITEVDEQSLVIGLKTFFASQFLWAISIAAFRLAILQLYIELFGRVKLFKYSAYATLTIVCLFFIGSIVTSLRLCQPIAYAWDRTIAGSCGDLATTELAAAAFNMGLDVVIVLLPLPVIWRLQVIKQKKIGVTVTFTLGLCIAGINLGRIIKVFECSVEDLTYCTKDSAILTAAEMAAGIMVACIPTLGGVTSPSRYRPKDTRHCNKLTDTTAPNIQRYRPGALAEDSAARQAIRNSIITNTEPVSRIGDGACEFTVHSSGRCSESKDTLPGGAWGIGVKREIEITTTY